MNEANQPDQNGNANLSSGKCDPETTASRHIIPNIQHLVAGPGGVGQFSSTTADVYLRSDHVPTMILGRPVICAIRDCWGHFLYSQVITFENASYWSAAIALENALVNKVEYCAQYGVTITEDEWPVQFLPAELIVDGGELSTRKADHLVRSLGIRISTLPPYRGDLKGIVERHFGLLNGQLVRFLPGALPRFPRKASSPRHLDSQRMRLSSLRRQTARSYSSIGERRDLIRDRLQPPNP